MKQKINIIFEDDFFIIIDKPAGILIHNDGRSEEYTLNDFLKDNYPDLENIGNPHTLDSGRYEKRFGVVNRLDKEVSGLIIVAKNDLIFSYFQDLFIQRKIEKKYLAKTFGKYIGPKEGIIDAPLSRHKKDPRIWLVGEMEGIRNSKREAKTFFEFLENNDNKSLFILKPITGRTHQLRLHMRYIGHPIIGDHKYGINGLVNIYGIKEIEKTLKSLKQEDYIYDKNEEIKLIAKSLRFTHPQNFEEVYFESGFNF